LKVPSKFVGIASQLTRSPDWCASNKVMQARWYQRSNNETL